MSASPVSRSTHTLTLVVPRFTSQPLQLFVPQHSDWPSVCRSNNSVERGSDSLGCVRGGGISLRRSVRRIFGGGVVDGSFIIASGGLEGTVIGLEMRRQCGWMEGMSLDRKDWLTCLCVEDAIGLLTLSSSPLNCFISSSSLSFCLIWPLNSVTIFEPTETSIRRSCTSVVSECTTIVSELTLVMS